MTSVALSPNGKMIASWSYDNTVRLLDASSGAQVGEPLEGHNNWVESVVLNPDGKMIASDSWDNTVRLWGAFTPPRAPKSESLSRAPPSGCPPSPLALTVR